MKLGLMGAAVAALAAAAIPALAAEETPAIVKSRHVDTVLSADGLYTQTIHIEIQATNAAVAQDIGQQRVPFDQSLEDLDIVEAYTLKANGEKIAVGPNAIYTQQAQTASQNPQFDDQRQKVIVFPNFSGGDTVAYTARWKTKRAQFPGQFFYHEYFPKSVAYEDVEETLVAPKNFPLQVENHDVQFEKKEAGDSVTYRWRYRAPKPVTADLPRISPYDSVPRFYVTSFANYDDFGHAYAAMIAPEEAVTPRIQALADQLTDGVTDKREQARKIYEWVSKNVRYVAIDIANSGGYIPHEADAVLANAYGDCKDHATLFATLLKAKGIASETVLINVGGTYSLPQIANLATMNHAITWLPDFKIYADTTAGLAPFGVLPFEEYGKPVIHAVAAGPVRRQTPVLAAEAALENVKTVARIDKNGVVTGNTVVTATGPFSIALRSMGLAIQGTGPARFAAALLEKSGHAKGTGTIDVSPPMDLANVYAMQGSFAFELQRGTALGARFEMMRGLVLGSVPGDELMGPLFDEKLKDTEPTLCFSGRVVEELSLEAPEGREFARAPQDVRIHTINLEFTAQWSLSGKTLTVRREFVTNINRPICDGLIRHDTVRALNDIRRHYSVDLVSLAVPGVVTLDYKSMLSGAARAELDGDLDSALRLYSAATELMGTAAAPSVVASVYTARGGIYARRKDYNRALADFSRALRADPNSWLALRSRGAIYHDQGWLDKALADYSGSIRANPQDVFGYALRAGLYADQGRLDPAIEDCTNAIRIAKGNTTCYAIRAIAYYIKGDFENVIADANQALRLNPDNRQLFYQRGMSYLLTGQYRNAIADFDNAVKGNSRFATAFYARGIAKTKFGDGAAGAADIKTATDINGKIGPLMAGYGVYTPEFAKGVADVATCKLRPDDAVDGIIICNRVLSSGDLPLEDKFQSILSQGINYFMLRQYDEALAYFDKANTLQPDDALTVSWRGLAHQRKGDNELAVAEFDAAIRLAPTNANRYRDRAEFYAGIGDTIHAEADFAEAIKLAPQFGSIYRSRARMYERSDQFDKAIADANTLVRLDQSPNNYGFRCYVLAFADRLTQAMADCQKVLLMEPRDSSALGARGFVYMKLGEDAKAMDDFEQAIRSDRNNADAYYGRGLLKVKAGDAGGNDDIADAGELDADLVARLRRRGLKP